MIAYHFCFDLTYYGWASWRMLDDRGWIVWRTGIVTAFLLVVGVSLAVRDVREHGTPDACYAARPFVSRWAQIAAAALLVTAGSALLFPQSFIYFGVLHFVAVALWLCRRAPRWGDVAIGAGLIAIAAGQAGFDAMDPKWIDWLGFAATKPVTEDYVPLFPWLGVVLVGCGLGARWVRHDCRLAAPVDSAWRALPAPVCGGLAWLGRHSLAIYLAHQPLLLGTLGVVKSLGVR